MESNNFYQVLKMTSEEKFKMYMKVPHEDLVKMKIESERLMEIQDARIEQLERELYQYKHD